MGAQLSRKHVYMLAPILVEISIKAPLSLEEDIAAIHPSSGWCLLPISLPPRSI